MGRTGTFLFGQTSGHHSNIGASYVSQAGSTGQVLVRDNNEMMDSQSLGLAQNINLEATQAALFESANEEREFQRKLKKRLKKNQKQKQKLKQKLQNQAKIVEGKVCRICLGEENEKTDPLISPCKCAGTMSHIHLECLREWLNSKRSRKESAYVKTYCWKALECELCKVRFPGQVFPDGTIVSDQLNLSYKQIKKMGKPIEILDFERPEVDFIVLESVTLQNIRIIHVITMNEKQFIKVGRGHETDIRVTDISVSRFHAKINRSLTTGEYFVEDNKSKFGTLVQVRKPFRLEKNKNNYLQMGRTMLQIRIEDEDLVQTSYKSDTSSMCQALLCCKKRQKKVEYLDEPMFEFYPPEWDPLPQDNLDETSPNLKDNGTHGIEQTRDEDQPSAAGNLNQSALQNDNIHNREESPQLNFTHQQEEIPPENPIVLQAVEQNGDRQGQEETKMAEQHALDPSLINDHDATVNMNHQNQFGNDAQPPPQGEATVRVSAQNFLQMQALYLDQNQAAKPEEEGGNEVIGQRKQSSDEQQRRPNDQQQEAINANRIVSEELKMMNEDGNGDGNAEEGQFTDSKNALISQQEEQNQHKTGIKTGYSQGNKSIMNISQDIRSQLDESPIPTNKKAAANVLMGLETGLNTKTSAKIQGLPFKGVVDTSQNIGDASLLGITPTQGTGEIIGDGLKVVNDKQDQTHRTDNQMMVLTPRMGVQNTQEQVIDGSQMATPLASNGPFSIATLQQPEGQNPSSLLQNDNTADYQ